MSVQFILRASRHAHGGNCYFVHEDEPTIMAKVEDYVAQGYGQVELTLVPSQTFLATDDVIAAFINSQKRIRIQ